MEDHVIRFEYQVGKGDNEHRKYVMRLMFEKIVKEPCFDDLTETAVRDVLIKMIADWNYYKKK